MRPPILGVIALLLAAMAGVTAPAATARPLQASDIGADYVVIVDISGSMNEDGRYRTFLAALPRLIDDLDPSDRLSVYTFDNVVHSVYTGPALPAAELIPKLPATVSVDAITDLGPPIAAALDHLHRPDAGPIATVVLVTDGQHNPPSASDYAELSGPAWAELARSVRASNQASMSVYAVLVGAGVFNEEQVERIFGTATVLRPTDSDELGESFVEARAQATATKQRLWESDRPVIVEPEHRAADPTIVPLGVVVAVGLFVAMVVAVLLARRRSPTLVGTLEVSSGRESTVLTRIRLEGRRTELSGTGFPGYGWVVPIPDGIRISYSRVPETKPVTRRCAAGKSIILGGNTFTYLSDVGDTGKTE